MSNYKFNDWFLKKQLEAIDDIMKNNNMTWDEEVFDLEGMKNVKWVKSTNYKVDGKSLG